MPPLVQEYLRDHTLVQLKAEHGVNSRIHRHKFSLNYDQLEVDNLNPLASQCRGLILAPKNATESTIITPDSIVGETIVLARPMDRFFNYGQSEAANIDFGHKETVFWEKCDGTLISLYWDRIIGQWHVSTRAVPEADLPIDGFSLTFRNLFEKTILEMTGIKSLQEWADFVGLDPNLTYVLELCTPVNRVVVSHSDYKIWLLAMRDIQNNRELNIHDPRGNIGIPRCPNYRLNNLNEMLAFVDGRDPLKHEGIVAMDINFNRVKIKNASYVALSRVKDSALRSPRALLELCLVGRLDDALPLLPEHVVQKALEVRENLKSFLINCEITYNRCVSRVTSTDERERRKQMAIAIQEDPDGWMGYMMARFIGRCSSFEEFMASHKEKATGAYSRSFLETLLGLI